MSCPGIPRLSTKLLSVPLEPIQGSRLGIKLDHAGTVTSSACLEVLLFLLLPLNGFAGGSEVTFGRALVFLAFSNAFLGPARLSRSLTNFHFRFLAQSPA